MQYSAVLFSVKKESNRVKLGKAIRLRRKGLCLSQEKLAEHIDCHRNYVGLVERGTQNLTVDMLCRFAKGLKCTVAQLMQEAGL
jgi:transcriptional regulator with XRE-family HTH domain